MSLTQTQVISNALALLGNKPILSTEGKLSDIVQAAVLAYNFLIRSVLSKANWRFAIKIVQLPQLLEVPTVQRWQYMYQLPGDYLKLIRLFPHNQSFELFANGKLYTNMSGTLNLEYVFLPEQTAYPDYFNHYFVYELASYLALSNAQSPQYYAPLRQEREYQLAQALAADAQNSPSASFMPGTMITSRDGSSDFWGY